MEYVEIQSELKDSQKPEEKWKTLNNNLEALHRNVLTDNENIAQEI